MYVAESVLKNADFRSTWMPCWQNKTPRKIMKHVRSWLTNKRGTVKRLSKAFCWLFKARSSSKLCCESCRKIIVIYSENRRKKSINTLCWQSAEFLSINGRWLHCAVNLGVLRACKSRRTETWNQRLFVTDVSTEGTKETPTLWW
jgi:hypothetical protein